MTTPAPQRPTEAAVSIEGRVLAALTEFTEGTDGVLPEELVIDLTYQQVVDALHRLSRKGLAECARWPRAGEKFLWFSAQRPQDQP